MLVFQIVAYVAFGFLCISWIISGVKKLNNIRSEQQITADEKESIIPKETDENKDDVEKLSENENSN